MSKGLATPDVSLGDGQSLFYHSGFEKLSMLDRRDEHRVWRWILDDLCVYINLVLVIVVLALVSVSSLPSRSVTIHSTTMGHSKHQIEDWNWNPTDFSQTVAEGWKDCGHSPEEARAKGCVYDVMLVAWLHPDCFDHELHETYLSDTDWPFWIDRELQHPISLDEVRLGKHRTVFSNQEFHLAHCAYFLEQSVRGFRDGRGVVDNVTLDNEHTEHCARTLRDVWLPEMGYSPLHMDWHSCGRPAA